MDWRSFRQTSVIAASRSAKGKTECLRSRPARQQLCLSIALTVHYRHMRSRPSRIKRSCRTAMHDNVYPDRGAEVSACHLFPRVRWQYPPSTGIIEQAPLDELSRELGVRRPQGGRGEAPLSRARPMFETILNFLDRYRGTVWALMLVALAASFYFLTRLEILDSPERWMPRPTVEAWKVFDSHFDVGDTVAVGLHFTRPITEDDLPRLARLRKRFTLFRD